MEFKEKGVRNEKLALRVFQYLFTIFILEWREKITQESTNLCASSVKFTIIQNVTLNTYYSLFVNLLSLLAFEFSVKSI